MKRAALAVLLLLLALHTWAIAARAGREPHMDETEYVHAGWMMANGERLYETFFEHHSPFLFKALEMLAPQGTGVDVHPYFVRARRLFGLVGLLALIAIAAMVWRSDPWAAPLAVSLILATGPLWLRGFLDVRAESFALAFFFAGTWLVLRSRGPLSGVGIGLVAISCLWMPKWPLNCVVIGLFWLVGVVRERRVGAVIAAILTTAAGFAAIRLLVPFDAWWFFNFEVNRTLARGVEMSKWARDAHFQGGVSFLFVPDAFHPLIVVPAALLVAGAAWIRRNAERFLPVALFVASWIEIRFLYPWPSIWAHYYLMWGIASAAVLALVPSSVTILLERAGMPAARVRQATALVLVSAFVLVLPHVAAVAVPDSGDQSTYWVSQKYLRERLGPGDVVWVEPTRHPVSARDAHYYWFSVGQMLGAADQLRRTPNGSRFLPPTAPLPPCAPTPQLRFTLHPGRPGLPEATRCMEQLIANGEMRRTMYFDVYERLPRAGSPSR